MFLFQCGPESLLEKNQHFSTGLFHLKSKKKNNEQSTEWKWYVRIVHASFANFVYSSHRMQWDIWFRAGSQMNFSVKFRRKKKPENLHFTINPSWLTCGFKIPTPAVWLQSIPQCHEPRVYSIFFVLISLAINILFTIVIHKQTHHLHVNPFKSIAKTNKWQNN